MATPQGSASMKRFPGLSRSTLAVRCAEVSPFRFPIVGILSVSHYHYALHYYHIIYTTPSGTFSTPKKAAHKTSWHEKSGEGVL